MKIMHPSSKELQAWLDGNGAPRVDKHLETCDRCAETLENQVGDNQTPTVHDALATVLKPTNDMTDQVAEAVRKRLDNREVLEIFGGLFASGVETTKILVTEEGT